MSKFSLDDLEKYVYPHLTASGAGVIQGAIFGEDVALTRVGSDILVSHLDPIIGAVKDIGWLAVHVACNDIATSGALPRWIQILVIVPSQEDVAILDQVMSDIEKAASEIGVSVIGGHTGYSDNLSRTLVAVTAMGTLSGQEPVLTKGAQVGDHVLVTKGIALEGTAILAGDFSQTALKLGLTKQDIAEADDLIQLVSVIPEGVLLGKRGASAMHDVTRGGLLETLLEIASLSDVGIEVEYDRLPIPTIVSRFAEHFQFDPLKMISSGTLVATVPESRLEAVKRGLDKQGIPFADIGQVVHGKGVKIHREGKITHYEEIHPEDDELARMWTLYPTDTAA